MSDTMPACSNEVGQVHERSRSILSDTPAPPARPSVSQKLGRLLGWFKRRTPLFSYLLLGSGFAATVAGYERRLRRLQRHQHVQNREADNAQAIQLATLVEPPPHPDFDIAVRYEPVQAVGGDFYSFFTANTRLGVILGDVSGKGIPAALVSTSICHLAPWLRPMEDPSAFLADLNRTLLEQLPMEAFASMIAALIDPETGRLVIYNAGHPPGLIVSDNTVRRSHLPNLPLGMFPEVPFLAETWPFGRGDTLLFYSDGFTEVRNQDGEQLTVEGLEELVRQNVSLSPEELASRLIEEAHAFGTVTDDLTLVVVRRVAPDERES